MQKRQLGTNGPWVSALGLGCMGMTPIYAAPDPDEAVATIHAAVDAGITMIDTADMYAGGKNEELVGRALKGIRDKVVLASKFGNMRLPLTVRVPSTASLNTFSKPATRRSSAWTSISSIYTTCTVWIRMCRSRIRSARWRN